MDLLEKIDNITKNSNRHGYFQLLHFVIGKEPTTQARMQTCIQEMAARKRAMEAITLEIAEQRDQLELFQMDIDELTVFIENEDCKYVSESDYRKDPEEKTRKKRKLQLQLNSLERKKTSKEIKLSELQASLKGTTEEAVFFLTTFEQLTKVEKLKDWDDPQVQKEYWSAKYLEELNTRIAFGVKIDPDLIRSISALPDDTPAKSKLVSLLVNQKREIERKV